VDKEEEKQVGKFFSFFNKNNKPVISGVNEIDPWFSDRTQYLTHLKLRLEHLVTHSSALINHHFGIISNITFQ
jgi:hypothetical protein